MADQIKNLMIGLFVTAAAAIVVFMLMFLHPRIGDEGKTLRARFTDIDKVNLGTRVTYAGKPVGEVVNIKEVEDGRSGPTDPSGRVYIYELTLHVDSGVDVFNTDEILVRTSGLLGEKNVDISPIAPKPGQKLRPLEENEIIFAQPTGTVEETFREFKEASDKVELAMDSATDVLNRVLDNKLVEKITATVENMQSISAALNKPDQWTNIILNLDRFMKRLNKSWDTVDKTLASISEAADNAKSLIADGQGVIAKVSNGEGTLGKLLTTDDVYLRTSSIMSKLETILDDINHYGLLFQSDKGWQRLRARRLNLLQKLRTPQEFRNYFNDEINEIYTSLSRVYMVLSEMDSSCCRHDLMQDREFTKVFAELMRRVTMLEEEVRLYNTQVVDAQVHDTELGSASYGYPGNECGCYPEAVNYVYPEEGYMDYNECTCE